MKEKIELIILTQRVSDEGIASLVKNNRRV